MNRNELLIATRETYLQRFLQSIDHSLSDSVEGLFRKADSCNSALEQCRYLDARGILRNRAAELQQHMHSNMNQLLNRSLQTTYSTFRPSISADFDFDSLALVDVSALEDELRIVRITEQFRAEAEEQVRDLNIRIALLFEQDQIKERENPFRPYLLSRSIAASVDYEGVSYQLATVLIAELAEHLAPRVAGIYESVNALLAQNGIAAQLQSKIIKSAYKETSPYAGDRLPMEFGGPPAHQSNGAGNAWSDATPAPDGAEAAGRLVDQLFDFVRGIASAAVGAVMPAATQSQIPVPNYGAAPGQFMPNTPAPTRNLGGAGWVSSGQKIGAVLRKFFSGQGSPGQIQSDAIGPPGANELTPALATSVDFLLQQQTPASADMLGADGEVRNLLLEQRASLNGVSTKVDEQMTIDVVAMLFEFILRDMQIPAEVRAQLGRLQFLVLKIALLDATLLTQKGHPARLLVNRIGSISLGLKQVDPSGVRVTAEISRIVETLLNDESGSSDLFSRMLDEFDAFIAKELRGGDNNVEQAINVAQEAQNRTLRFVHASAKMNETLSGLTIDPLLSEFFVGPWMQAVERAERTDAGLAARMRELVPDLLWSIVPKTQKEDQDKLVARLPFILTTLREGLDLTDWSAERKQEFMDWLMEAHTQALRSGSEAVATPSLWSLHQHFKKFTAAEQAESGTTDVSRNPAKYKQFLDEAVKELDIRIQLLDRMFNQEYGVPDDAEIEAAEAEDGAPEASASVMERLRNGVAIEISLGGKPSVGRLIWIDPGAAHMMLTLDRQSEPAMISVRMFRRQLDSGRVRFLESAPLFERAVESLLNSAEQMDARTSGPHATAGIGPAV